MVFIIYWIKNLLLNKLLIAVFNTVVIMVKCNLKNIKFKYYDSITAYTAHCLVVFITVPVYLL